MSKAPPIPKEQRSFREDPAQIGGANAGRRDMKTGLQSSEPGDGDTNFDEQGRQGNLKQNVADVRRSVQNR